MKKRILLISLLSISAVGIYLFSVPFSSSLNPSERADALLPRLDITKIKKGTFKIQEHPAYGEPYNSYKWSVLVYRKKDGNIKIWNIPTRNGSVGMPNLHWWRPAFECKHFGPTLINGVVDETKPIKCHDKKEDIYGWEETWFWDIDGKHISNSNTDLRESTGIIEGNYFVFGKSS